MSKSVYSIVLSDEVVQAIDDLAYSMGTSRSNLIDRILAERVSCKTPEMRIRDIFDLVERSLGARFTTTMLASGSVMQVKTPLRFKYKPTVRYSVELERGLSGRVGTLRAAMRTSSEELSRLCGDFFRLWELLERKHLGQFFEGGFPAKVTDKGYERDLYEIGGKSMSDDEIAAAISDYIDVFSQAMNLYFANAADPEAATALCEQRFKEYLSDGVRVI